MKKIRFIVLLIAVATALQGQINISNRTDIPAAEVISEIIARDIIGFDTLTLILFPLPANPTIDGILDPDQTRPHTYTLFLNPQLSLKGMVLTLAHEFIHIKQYEFEGLEIFGDIWVWNPEGKEPKQDVTWGSMTFTGYEIRGFEIDAYERQYKLAKQVHKIFKERNMLAKMKELI